MAFNLRQILRQIQPRTLRPYFESKQLAIPKTIWDVKPKAKLPVQLANHLLDQPGKPTEDALAGLVRVYALASEKGELALLNSTPDRLGTASTFASLDDHAERALWFLTNHPDQFREAEGLHFFDHHTERRDCRHFLTATNVEVSREKGDTDSFKRDVCAFYREYDGSGISCEVEFIDRRQDDSIQVAIFLQGLPDNRIEVVESRFTRRVSSPAIEATVVYEPQTGHTATVARGGKKAHEAIREAFARTLLKIEPQFDPVTPRSFLLNSLRTRRALAPDPAAGIAKARVRTIRLTPRYAGAGVFSIEAPGGQPNVSVYDLADDWFSEGSRLLQRFNVAHATLALHFHPKPGTSRAKTLNVELTWPNTSNLKDLEGADRQIAEVHIAKWGLVESANGPT